MNKRISIVGTIAIAMAGQLFVASQCQAQRGMFRGQNLMASLLGMEKVLEELDLTDEQIEEATELVEDLNQSMREQFQDMAGASREEMQEAMQEIQADLREREAEALKELLKEEQMDRLKQLMVQRMGARAINTPEVAQQLKITDEQKEKLEAAIADNRQAMMERFQEMRESGDRAGMREVMAELEEELNDALMAVLTDDQQEKLEELKGEKFDFPPPPRRGGGRTDF